MNDEIVRLFSCDTFPELLQRPFSRGMTRRVEMQNPAGADFHDNEHIDKTERCGHHDEEVTRDDRFGMIPHERHPTLGSHSGMLRFRRHIAPDRSRGNLNADLQQELVGDPFLAPCRIVLRHFSDQLPNLDGHPRTTGRLGLPFPEQPKSFPMPADQRIGFHHCERIAPFEESRKLGQGETNGVGGPVRFRLSLHV